MNTQDGYFDLTQAAMGMSNLGPASVGIGAGSGAGMLGGVAGAIPLVGAGLAVANVVGQAVNASKERKREQEMLVKYNKDMTRIAPNPYDDQGYKQSMPTFKKGGMLKKYKTGGKVKAAAHVIPADRTHLAQADARKAGVVLQRIPGNGSPTADDKMLRVPGVEPVMVSSGEMVVDDDEFMDMAAAAGMDKSAYQMRLYPNSPYMHGGDGKEGVQKAAQGGQFGGPGQLPYGDGSAYQGSGFGQEMMILGSIGQQGGAQLLSPELRNPLSTSPSFAGRPRNRAELANTMMNVATAASPGTADEMGQALDANRSAMGVQQPKAGQTSASSSSPVPMVSPWKDIAQDGANLLSPEFRSQPPASAPAYPGGPLKIPGSPDTDVTKAGKDDGTITDQFDQMEKMNAAAAASQIAPVLASGIYNLFSKRTVGRPPMSMQPDYVDFNTEGMRGSMEGARQRGTATAIQASRGTNNLAPKLAIGANDQSARREIAAQVQGVENQQEQINTGLSNDFRQKNVTRRDQYEAQEAAADNQHRLMKGEAFNNSLAGLSQLAGGFFQNKIGIAAQRQLFGFQTRLYDAMAGVNSSRYATPRTITTGETPEAPSGDETSSGLSADQAFYLGQMLGMWGGRGYRYPSLKFSGLPE